MNTDQQLTEEQAARLKRAIDGLTERFAAQLAISTARMEKCLSNSRSQTQNGDPETTSAPWVDTWRETVYKINVERAVERVVPRISILAGPKRW